MASASAFGLASLALAHNRPEHRVVGVAAAVVAHRGADGLGHAVDFGDELFDRLIAQIGAFNRLVQVIHVSLVMLVVMDFHRSGVDRRFQRVKRIRQRGQRVCHGKSLPFAGC